MIPHGILPGIITSEIPGEVQSRNPSVISSDILSVIPALSFPRIHPEILLEILSRNTSSVILSRNTASVRKCQKFR